MQAIMLVIKFIPVLIELMRGLEQAFPNSGWGPFRLGLLKAIFGRLKDIVADGKVTMSDVMPLVEGIIEDIAEAMNKKPEAWVVESDVPPLAPEPVKTKAKGEK